MTKTIIYSLFIFLTVACSQRTTFSDFTNNFVTLKTAIYDSTFFATNFKIDEQKLELIDPEDRTFINNEFVNEMHGDQNTYEVYYLNKTIIDDKLALTYYLTLNRNIPFDAYIQRVVLCTYDLNTEQPIDFEEIATLEQHFGQSIKRWSTWTGEQISTEEKKVTEDLNNGSIEVEKKNCESLIDHKGLINKNCG